MNASAPARRPFSHLRVSLGLALLLALTYPSSLAPRMLSAVPPSAIDLSTFVRVSIFNLPEPTRTAAPPNSLLAQEASAVTYNWDTGTLFIVGDGGTSVVQVSKTGVLIDSMTLAPGGSPQGTDFYDTEGLTYVGGGQFVLIEERYRQVNLFTYVPGGTLHRADVRTVKLGTTIGNVGLEGISYDPYTGGFVLVKEKDPESIFETLVDFNAGTASNGSPSATSATDLFVPALANLADFSDVFSLSNLPFLSGQADYTHLLVISQESGQIINVDRFGTVSSRLTIAAPPGSPFGVADMTMEGLTMDRDGYLYVVNENGGGDPSHPQLWVYAHSDAANVPPTSLSLGNPVSTIPENTSTAAPVKLADLLVADDGLGVNNLGLVGPDANAFQIIGSALFLKAGTALSAIGQPSYHVTITVNDPAVNGTPDAQVAYTLGVTAAVGGTASLIISEVAPWSSGSSPASLRVDWFEVTNIGTAAANIAGWKMDDNSNSAGSAAPLTGISSIAPGESVIFMETTDALRATKKAAFLSTWFGANPPLNLQVGSYNGAGVGLSTDPGDAVNLYNSANVLQANVVFGLSPTGPFRTFDNGAGLNNTTITALSATGINGAFVAAGDATEIGSPGTIGGPSTPVVTITATDATADETGPDSGSFRIARTGSLVSALAVNYSIAAGAGKATSADYAPLLTNVATIPSGQSFVDIVVTPVNDSLFEGPEALTLTLFDTGSYDVGSPATATVTIADNDPPNTAITSAPATPTSSTSAMFAFSGSEPVSALAGFECAFDGAAFMACSSPVSITGVLDGAHTFAVRAIDVSGRRDPTPASATWVVDTGDPIITVGASQTTLWPPNGQMVPDRITGTVADALSGVNRGSVVFRVIDSQGSVQPGGTVVVDAGGGFGFTVMLEASRLGTDKDGRRYDIVITASDGTGNQTSRAVVVTVPHDQGK